MQNFMIIGSHTATGVFIDRQSCGIPGVFDRDTILTWTFGHGDLFSGSPNERDEYSSGDAPPCAACNLLAYQKFSTHLMFVGVDSYSDDLGIFYKSGIREI